MHNAEDVVIKNIRKYKRKFFLNLLLRGSIWSLAVLLAVFLLFSFAEHFAHFSREVRTVLFFAFLFTAGIVLYRWVLSPLLRLIRLDKALTDEEAAARIGSSFPEVRDKLINLLQLHRRQGEQGHQLLAASIRQKSAEISPIRFDSAITYQANTRYLPYLLPILLLFLAAAVFLPGLFTDSATRIVHYRQDFAPQAPFRFVIENETLQAFKNEDFTLRLRYEGESQPGTSYIWLNGRQIKMKQEAAGLFSYTFSKVQEEKEFSFEAAGFSSDSYELAVVERPAIQNFQVHLQYPSYLNKENERLANVGNFQIPEGTRVNWQFKTLYTDSLQISFGETKKDTVLQSSDNQLINYEKQLLESQEYSLKLFNQWSSNKEPIRYQIEVIPDRHPDISLKPFADTTLFNLVVLGGNVADDYGLSRLSVFYKVKRNGEGETTAYKSIPLPLGERQLSQSYFLRWPLDSLQLRKGDQLEYFVKVWDNDGINGPKASQTSVYTLQAPNEEELRELISKAEQNTEEGIDKSVQQARKLEEKIQQAEDRLRGKKQVNYQDEKLLQEILEERKKMEEQLEKLAEESEALKQQRERFSEEQNKEIQEKAEQLQQLMNELLDEETKRLYEELQKLLEEKGQSEEFQNVLENLKNKEDNLEKELERALELFKRMKFDHQLEETRQEVEELRKEQEELAEQTGKEQQSTEELQQQQQELNKEFEEIKQSMDELEQLNQELKNPNPLQDFKEEQQRIEEQQKESQESLEKGKNKKAQKAQQKAAEKMKEMAQKMQEMQSGMQMSMMQENLDDLRNIVDNLLTLSFSQEELMKEFREINQSNPRFVNLAQQQLKIQEDAVILEDSLRSLAERVFQIQAFVTRELNDMNKYLDESVNAIKERKKNEAVGKQQFTMTSMNNLALLLDDVLQQMQEQMANAQGMPQAGNKNKKGEGAPKLSDLQKQLNQRIQQLKQSGKSGRQLSEELARLAAEQEKIRQALQELEEKYGNGKPGSKPGNKGVQEQMEETESDLVNKRLSRELIERQQEILTRLLETEKGMRERGKDDERKGETAKDYERKIPEAFEEYLRQKEKEVELLKSVPPKLNPYYKKEVNNYFKRLGL
ncbi:DUF4175 family protein [Nafulsella turpanensis]|uniref:DUF4175 family protein n=1 Tax=Nafulsella turpanensis TaxID=1265690 RepID=UPI00034AE659|nr:DUF4175 family protein [Nafulsella turpanensis]